MRTHDIFLFERDRELAAIDVAIEDCQSEQGHLLVIEGAPGLGKSSLLAALRHRASGKGFTVLQARGVELESDFPYGVVRQLFENRLASLSPQARDRVLSGPAELAAPLFDYGARGALRGGEGAGQYSCLYGLYWMCVHLAGMAPLALLIDDVEFVDGPSLRFLHYLAARLEDRPILLAIGTDPVESDHRGEIIRAITANPVAQVLQPRPLSAGGVHDHLAAVLDPAAATRYAAVCHAATGGVPFLLSELVGEVAAAELEQRHLTPAQVAELTPPKVVHLVLRRLERLPATAVALVEAMAVLGPEADLKHAAETAGLDQRAVPGAQGALADAGLLRPDVPPRFVHSIVRAAIYHNLGVSARNLAHARAAQVLAEADAPVEDIAGHLLRASAAGDPGTVAVLREAAGKAVAERRDALAVTYLTRALREPPTREVLPGLLVDLGTAELRCRLPEGLDHLAQAVDLVEDPVVRGRVGLDLVAALTAAARNEEAAALLETLRAETAHAGDADHAALLDAALLSTARQTPGLGAAARAQLRRIEAAEPVHRGLGHLLAVERAAEALRRGESARTVMALADDMLKETFAEGVTLPIHDATVYPWRLATFVLTQCDRMSEADRLLTLLVEGAAERGAALAADAGHGLRAWVRVASGRLTEAEADARLVLDRATPGRATGETAYAVAALAEVLTARQELAEARLLLDQYDQEGTDGTLATLPHVPLTLAQGRLYAAQSRTDDAVAVLESGRRLLEGRLLRHPTLALAIESALIRARAGHTDEVRALADARLQKARAFGAPRMIAGALRVCGLVSSGSRAVALLRESVDVLVGTEARLDRAAASVDLGAALRLEGRLEQARAELTRGMERAENCGAWALAKSARAELAAMGVRVRITKATGVDGLTAQERRVAVLAAKGQSNRDIARSLFVTIKTVEWHLNRAYRKLGITSRGELAGALAGEYAVR
ncbi:helix-turn-helix transcriptional regulator [Streptomyces sp. SBT349]|uniref:helix-turn-helix transcriptional regulator n=1 Tax=Streptomyces sp. SBT349 TaxID=1580539 RepID=UPI000A8B7938|nr:LuxR family transcriptional regulator [Streptomyces sp. SBT349]